ncbi:MAG: site-specific integrase [Solirubrobacterales bacterium]|nr:site-specific integrase [Solirubrobacterales bacterium]
MSVEKIQRAGGAVVWRVRWRQHGRNRARTFSTRRDAADFDAEVRRQRRGGSLAALDAGAESLGEYITGAWATTHAVTLAPKTRLHYASLYDHHLRPLLGSIALRDIDPEMVGRWQSDRLAAGAGPAAVRQALDLLGSVLEQAFVSGRVVENPVRRVKKARLPRREEVQALSPASIETMRAALDVRDAALLSVLAYAGLRPGEALGLRSGDIRERTILVQRSVSLGEEADTKTRQHRTVRLLAPLAADLRSWRMAAGCPAEDQLVFPGKDGQPWTQAAYQSWRRRAFRRATQAAGVAHARPYDLRHSFASLLLHEGRSVIYVARQLGHDARLTLTRYGHVIDELEDVPRIEAEVAIAEARRRAGPRGPAAVSEFGS